MEKYKQNIICDNCGLEATVFIEKGISADDFIRGYAEKGITGYKCTYCGCRTVRKA